MSNLNNMNIDENTVNKLKDMMNKGELNDMISKISPEMIENFSSMMSNNPKDTNDTENSNLKNPNTTNNSNFSKENNTSNNFDFSNIDINTIMKMKSIMEKMNSKDDPRSNLLYSLKPYLRESKKEKLDQYANLLNIAKLSELFKNDNKGS